MMCDQKQDFKLKGRSNFELIDLLFILICIYKAYNKMIIHKMILLPKKILYLFSDHTQQDDNIIAKWA